MKAKTTFPVKILIQIIAVLAIFYFGLQFFATGIVTKAMEQSLGTKVKVERVHLKLFPIEFGIYGMKIMNYKGFEEPVMISIPEVFVSANPAGLFKKTVHVRKVVFDLDKVTVEKNRHGKINLKVLMDTTRQKAPAKTSQPSAPGPAQPTPEEQTRVKKAPDIKLKIDEASMSLRKVYYVDYGTGARVERSFDLNIDHILLKDAADLNSLTEQVAVIVLQKIGMLAIGDQVQRVASQLLTDAQTAFSNIFEKK